MMARRMRAGMAHKHIECVQGPGYAQGKKQKKKGEKARLNLGIYSVPRKKYRLRWQGSREGRG